MCDIRDDQIIINTEDVNNILHLCRFAKLSDNEKLRDAAEKVESDFKYNNRFKNINVWKYSLVLIEEEV